MRLRTRATAFDKLGQFVGIITRVAPRRTENTSLGWLQKSRTHEARLFRALQTGRDRLEREISVEVMGVAPDDHRYRVARHRLKELLVSYVWRLELPATTFSEYIRRLYALRRRAFAITILRYLGERGVSMSLAKKALDEAFELEEWITAIEMAQLLREDMPLAADLRGHERYTELWREATARYMAAQESYVALQHVRVIYSRSGAEHAWLLPELEAAAEHVERAAQEHPCFTLEWAAYEARSTAVQLHRDYRHALELCDRATMILRAYPLFANKSNRVGIVMKQAACAYYLHEYALLAHRLEQADELTSDLSFNWFMNRQFEFLLLMHTSRFTEAFRLCRLVMNRSGFTLQGEAFAQRWQIFLLYAEYMTGEEPVAISIEQFLKLAPVYGRDKAGFNLSMVILQVLVEIRSGSIDRAAERIESLRAYRKRYLTRGYLRGEQGSGPDAFFRLLTIAQSYGFDAIRARKQAKRLADELPDLDFDPTEEAMYVLPFATLWELLLTEMEHAWAMQPASRQARARELVAAALRPGRRGQSINFWAQVLAEERERLEAEAMEGERVEEVAG